MKKQKILLSLISILGIGTLFVIWYGEHMKHWFDTPPYTLGGVLFVVLALITLLRWNM